MCIDDTMSKEDKTNYETKIFKVIKTLGYNGAAVIETLSALNLDIFTPAHFSSIITSD